MSIYIKGMEMPTTCGKCKIKNAIKCNKWELVRSVVLDRHRDCPLIPVPPHGRLIDEDVLIKTAHNQWPLPIDFLKLLELVPTVIPADGKDTDVSTREEKV